MMFWAIVVAMSAAAAAVLALPLFRKAQVESESAAFDLEVYHDQIQELERDCERGVLTQAEMEAARTEIARRMLAADARLKAQTQGRSAADSRPGAGGVRALAAILAIAVPAGAVLLYLELGEPGRPDMPLSARTEMPSANQDAGQEQRIAELKRRAEENPTDPQAWLHLGLTYKAAERYEEAVEAFHKVLQLQPATPLINSEYGEALLMAADGTVTPEARSVFESVLAAEPNDPRAMHYLALGDYQAGRTQAALDRWAALIASAPADAPWLGVIREAVTMAANDLGLDPASVMPEPMPSASGGGPMGEQGAAIAAMPPEEREAVIRDMVAGLEAKLAEDPMNLEGWERLIRARAVMGEREAAQGALDRALEAFAGAPVPRQRLAALGREMGLKAPAAEGAPDIGAMVARLAARLEREPDDLEGWLMLARSYAVMGEAGKAREAMATAVRLAPDDPTVIALEAAAVREANGGQHNAESIAILRRVLELNPDNTEALWFVGNAEAEAGNKAKALELLQRVAGQFPEASEDRAMVQKRIAEIEGG